MQRAMTVGAEPTNGGVHFRVWAPHRRRVAVALVDADRQERSRHELAEESGGYFAGLVPEARVGSLYGFRLDDEGQLYPDPASRFQPHGVHGPSEVIDADGFAWNDGDWPGCRLEQSVIYELHIGAFTPEGTWAAATAKLPLLRDVGVTLVEVMPVGDFDGQFGWGYDGVSWYAPTRIYGRPDDFRRFVDAAHTLGLGVILDVVYNHLGPTGNYTGAFCRHYTSRKHATDWGPTLNYDGRHKHGVRNFAVENAAYWIREFHLDGLRLDATQTIYDDSQPHLLADLSQAARAAAGKRDLVLIAENETQDAIHVAAVEDGGYGLDGMWNDDFHHACRVAATGHAEFYHATYGGSAQEICSAMRWGFLHQGQHIAWQNRVRGTAAWHLPPATFVNFLENHDQVSNSADGRRLHQLASPGMLRALTAALLLAPGTPMLFMGQEFGATSPFPFFADHEERIAEQARRGRWGYLRNFPRAEGYSTERSLPDPGSYETFASAKLAWEEREANRPLVDLHRELLRLRREDPTFARQDNGPLHGAVLRDDCFLLRWLTGGPGDRLLLVNLGRDLRWHPPSEPLVAAPPARPWRQIFSTEAPRYGGLGAAPYNECVWSVPGQAAVLLAASD